MGGGSSKAPAPDPRIGQAAMMTAKTGAEWLNVSKEQFAIANARQDKLDALTSQVTQSQLQSLNNANAWAEEDRERWKTVFQPMQDDFIAKAKGWDSPEALAKAAAEAKGDVMSAAAQAQQTRQRQMSGMGINPNSGRFAGIERQADTAAALASAGAQNNARSIKQKEAVALQADAINMGNGLPTQASQSLGLGVNTGNSVVGNNINTNQSWNMGNQILGSGYQTAMQGYQAQGSILNNLYANQVSAYNAQNNSGSIWNSVLGAAGTVGGALIMSDENQKEDKHPVSGALDAVRSMPVEEWSYKPGAGDGGRHIGTYAQHFQRATGKGDGKSIPVIDAIGVTMGAVKELGEKVDQLAGGRGLPPHKDGDRYRRTEGGRSIIPPPAQAAPPSGPRSIRSIPNLRMMDT